MVKIVRRDVIVRRLRGVLALSYKKLSSVETSIIILGLLALSFMAGSIFPQGADMDDYINDGGSFVFPVEALGLLDLFSSPIFLFLAALFILNLVICTFGRYKSLFAQRTFPGPFEPDKSFLVTQDANRAHEEVRRVVKELLGFRLVDKDGLWTVMEKGLPYRWLTWGYHAGFVVCMAGLVFTFLFAYDDTMALKAGSPQTVMPSTTGNAQSIWQEKSAQSDFHLLLDGLSTEYVETPVLDYPGDRKSRLAIGLGWRAPQYRIEDDQLFPTVRKARVKVLRSSSTLAEEDIETNKPLKYGGYAFYILGFEQALKLSINGSPILLEAKADNTVLIPGSTSTLLLGRLRYGNVTRLDGTVEELTPYVTVKYEDSDDAARLRLGDSVIVDGTVISLADYTESALLSYRYDPGVPLLWIGGIIVLIAISLRFYGPYYLLAYRVDDSDSIVCVNLHLSTKGIVSSPETVMAKIERELAANDLKPVALPSQP
ncbi:MAG: hypothetical protein A3I81_00710 [Deltaproteobacteria bacterium RIFCSPLOWO2_02_FULL_55_12]|nr:MAG: hypothetical protein A3I81_00710 [Deltaproteobacteria bacterium RIFCSPLOWO2_02_FULL_55_12]